METQRFYAVNDYPGDQLSFREILVEHLELAEIPYEEYLTASGFLEVAVDTGTGWDIVLIFDHEGDLLVMDVAVHEEAEEDEEDEEDAEE